MYFITSKTLQWILRTNNVFVFFFFNSAFHSPVFITIDMLVGFGEFDNDKDSKPQHLISKYDLGMYLLQAYSHIFFIWAKYFHWSNVITELKIQHTKIWQWSSEYFSTYALWGMNREIEKASYLKLMSRILVNFQK